jgi:hypothetical protein
MCRTRSPVLASDGLAGVLGTLHQDLAWRGDALERLWRTGECSLGGRGLQLLPSASEHATALRASGLVQTVRRGRGVNHSLTPLGRSLLNGNLNAH